LAGDVQEITVLFADIRGFTRRSAGQAPERVVELLNRFFTLAVRAVEERGGHVNKFLGDGIMALFGAARPRPDHADLAILSAQDLLERLEGFNQELAVLQQPPLVLGIGIHTGTAVVGCIGATLETSDGRQKVRKEFTAIGETVNLCQRIEQLTKTCGGPILLSEKTRLHLRLQVPLIELGPQLLPGCDEKLAIYKASCGR
jgi:adenylate cyclase